MTAARVSTRCPSCGAELRLKRNRSTREPFLGCTRYPHCEFSEGTDELLAELSGRLADLEASGSISDKLRGLVFELHPDRRGETVSTTEVVALLNKLRGEVAA